MAKGVITIKNNPSGGSLRITENNDPPPIGGGRGATAPLAAGDTANFTEAYAGNVGDLVSFTIDANGNATTLATLAPGTVITGSRSGTITVTSATPTLITAATIDGKVTVSGGGILVMTNASYLGGKIEASGTGSVVIVDINCRIDGKSETTGITTLVINSSTIDGKVSSTGDQSVLITGNTIGGKLEVLNAGTCRTSGNTVAGSVNTPGCTS